MAATGTAAKMRRQIICGLRAAVLQPILIGLFCILPLTLILLASGVAPTIGVYALFGVALPSIRSSMFDTRVTISELDQPPAVRMALGVVLWVYLNVTFLVAFSFGYAAVKLASVSIGTLVAISTPIVQLWLSKNGVPTVVWVVTRLMYLIRIVAAVVENVLNYDDSFSDALEDSVDVLETPDKMLTQFTQGLQSTIWL